MLPSPNSPLFIQRIIHIQTKYINGLFHIPFPNPPIPPFIIAIQGSI
nr:MAG TPA: hypothetical protein [Bacteriophage sp.]